MVLVGGLPRNHGTRKFIAMEGNSHGSVELQDLNGFLGQDDPHGIMVLDVTGFMPQRPAWWIRTGPVFLCWKCYQGESQLIRILCTSRSLEGRIIIFYRIHGTGIFTYIWLSFIVNVVGKYTIHGSYNFLVSKVFLAVFVGICWVFPRFCFCWNGGARIHFGMCFFLWS